MPRGTRRRRRGARADRDEPKVRRPTLGSSPSSSCPVRVGKEDLPSPPRPLSQRVGSVDLLKWEGGGGGDWVRSNLDDEDYGAQLGTMFGPFTEARCVPPPIDRYFATCMTFIIIPPSFLWLPTSLRYSIITLFSCASIRLCRPSWWPERERGRGVVLFVGVLPKL